MELTHMFYKELPLDEDNVFSADLAENSETEQVAFKKLKKYAISSLSINQDTAEYIPLLNIQGKKALSDILQTYSEVTKV